MTTDAQMPELLPCPFCGSGPAVSIQNASFSGVEALYWHGLHFVNCGMCGADGAKEEDRSDAIAAWNRRADLCASGQVRALEWTEYETEGWADRADAEAGSFGVFYNIDIVPDGYRVVFDHEAVGAIGIFETSDAAKAAAQADYERRILAALTPAPQPAGEAVPVSGNLFIDGDGDLCITGRDKNLVACLATDDADGGWKPLNQDVFPEIVRRWNTHPSFHPHRRR